MLEGLNHLTLAVRDVEKSLAFYVEQLGMTPHARWDGGAYLSCGALWLCLSQDDAAGAPPGDYTHYAFTVSEANFETLSAALANAGVRVWKSNRSEGNSFYFLDPDNHQLELHVGSLSSRLAACREKPYKGMRFLD